MVKHFGFLVGLLLASSLLLLMLRPDLPQRWLDSTPATAPTAIAASTAAEVVATEEAMPPATTQAVPLEQAIPLPVADAVPVPVTLQPPATQLFWSPFRSELAARGFASGISDRSTLEIAVIRTAPLSYRLAFEYGDEQERLARIALIEQATGLQLTGLQP